MTPDDLLHHASFIRSLARSLVRNEDDAADLEQEAWMAAVRHPPRESDAAKSWFGRVLRHSAINRHRGASRRARREAAAAHRDPEGPGPTPPEQAALLREVTEAVWTLPSQERDVVVLRFYEGLGVPELARRLGVSATTARERLQQGLARLRRHLDRAHDGRPGGWTPLLSALLRDSSPTKVATAAAAGGGTLLGWAMKPAVAVLILGAATALSWLVLASQHPEPVSPLHPLTVAEEDSGSGSRLAGSLAPIPSVPFEPEKAGIGTQVEEDVPRTLLWGRIVGEEDRVPIPGAIVAATFAGAGAATIPRGDYRERVVTGADGHFELVLPKLDRTATVRVEAEGRASQSVAATGIAAATDAGDVALAAGIRLRGSIVDAHGNPAPDAMVELHGPKRPFGTLGASESPRIRISADPEGGFETEARFAPGTWKIVAEPPTSVRAPDSLDLVRGTESSEARIALDFGAEPKIVRGLVEDESGQPIAEHRLDVHSATGNFLGQSRSNAAGRFRFVASNGSVGPVRFSAAGGDFEPPSPDAECITFGTTDARVRLRRAGILHLTVVDAASGTPLDWYGYQVHPVPNANAREENFIRSSAQTRRAAGVAEIRGVLRGRNVLSLLPWPGESSLHGPLEFVMPESGMTALRVELRPRTALEIEVVDQGGAPISGAVVSLLPSEATRSLRLRSEGGPIAKATAGPLGSVTLLVGSVDEDVGLSVLAAGFQSVKLRSLPEGDARGRRRITLERGGTVRGSVGPASVREALFTKPAAGSAPQRSVLQLEASGASATPWSATLEVAPDGSFQAQGVPSGRYRIHLVEWSRRRDGGGFRLRHDKALAEFELRAEVPVEVALDLGSFAKARATGDVRVNGDACADAAVRFVSAALFAEIGPGGPFVEGPSGTTDREGRFDLSGPAGAYYVVITLPKAEGRPERVVRDSVGVELRAGETVAHDVDLTPVGAQLRLVAARGGAPLKKKRVWFADPAGHVRSRTTDDDGWITIDAAPPSPFPLYELPSDASAFLEHAVLSVPELRASLGSEGLKTLGMVRLPAKDAAPRLTLAIE